MNKYIFYGSTGKIGNLLASVLPVENECIYVGRNEVLFNSKLSHEVSIKSILDEGHNIFFIDLSIDYQSIEAMEKHEQIKTNMLDKLKKTSQLKAYVGISSGAAQFRDELILDPFKLKYAQLKRKRKNHIEGLGVPYFFPEIFTLIGKKSYQYKKIGWVKIMDECLTSNEVCIGDPNEPRSWVSEDRLILAMKNFINKPESSVEGGLVDGVFCLQNIVDILRDELNKKIHVKPKVVAKWLTTTYLNQSGEQSTSEPELSFKDIITSIAFNKEHHA